MNFSLDLVLNGIPKPGPERDKAIGETWLNYTIYHYDKDVPDRCYYMLMDGDFERVAPFIDWHSGERATEEEAWGDCPKFSTNIAAAYEVEEAINSQGHRKVYTQCLAVVLLDAIPNNEEELWWAFAHANPEQRSRAAIIAWEKVRSQQSHDA